MCTCRVDWQGRLWRPALVQKRNVAEQCGQRVCVVTEPSGSWKRRILYSRANRACPDPGELLIHITVADKPAKCCLRVHTRCIDRSFISIWRHDSHGDLNISSTRIVRHYATQLPGYGSGTRGYSLLPAFSVAVRQRGVVLVPKHLNLK